MKLKRLIKKLAWSCGLSISIKRNPEKVLNEKFRQLIASMQYHDIDLVFDIGANVGQFAKAIRQAGYKGRIICFEPLPSAHMHLVSLSKIDPKIIVHPRTAVGAVEDTRKLYVAGNSVSSSLMEMLPSHSESAPEASYISAVDTPVIPLDDVFTEYYTGMETVMLKIDTQGYEWEVLKGASNSLSNIEGIMLELSLVPLYKGQVLWRDIIGSLELKGFGVWGLYSAFSDKSRGRTLQIDGVFYWNRRRPSRDASGKEGEGDTADSSQK